MHRVLWAICAGKKMKNTKTIMGLYGLAVSIAIYKSLTILCRTRCPITKRPFMNHGRSATELHKTTQNVVSMDIENIQSTIKRIAARSPLPKELRFGLFGSVSNPHSSNAKKGKGQTWAFGRPCTRRQIEAAELELATELPACVREFYKHVGNGGPGPGDGILTLEDAVALSPPLTKCFPHTQTWKNQSLHDQASHELLDLDRGMGSREDNDRKRDTYEQAKFPGGALVIARGMGCDFLVVANGPEMGNVWQNGANEIAPVCPAANMPWTLDYSNTSVRMSFAEWFNAWLLYADKLSLAHQDSKR